MVDREEKNQFSLRNYPQLELRMVSLNSKLSFTTTPSAIAACQRVDTCAPSISRVFLRTYHWRTQSALRLTNCTIMARNLRQVHDLTPTRVRESTVVTDFADFADVDMHVPPAFIMLSRKRNQEFLFQGVDLEVTFFWNFFVHLALYEQPHFLSVCGDSVSDAHLASRRYSDSLSLTLSLFQVRSGPSLRFF